MSSTANTHPTKTIRFYAGLTLAGTASAVLTCLFSLLHLQVFLTAYQLPLEVYSLGSSLFAVINTANDVLGAYIVDSLATTTTTCLRGGGGGGHEKHALVGWSGCLFALCFLTPFYRLGSRGNAVWGGGLHFVTSMSLYDTMYSFHCILLSSIITDHSAMSDKSRITFLAVGKLTNLVAPMMFAKLALNRLDTDNLQPLREFLVVTALVVCGISLVAQRLLSTPPSTSTLGFFGCRALPKSKVDESTVDAPNSNNTTTSTTIKKTKPLQFQQVVKDFVQHRNFRYWIFMELLLEAQTTFLKSFMKTFVDHLLLEQEGVAGGLSRSTCDWFLSSRHVLVAITSLGLLYVPMQRYGYAKVYSWVFGINLGVSAGLILWFGISSQEDGWLVLKDGQHLDHTGLIFFFLLFYPTILGAVGSAGFGLAMADMVLEMKQQHASQGRWEEPSLAGLFMGVNAFFCKPAESVLPILAATLLGKTDFRSSPSNATADNKTTETVLLRLLLSPPLICSILQLWAWSRYDLHPQKTARLRKEWESRGASKTATVEVHASNLDTLENQHHAEEQHVTASTTTKPGVSSRRQVASGQPD